MLSNVSFDADSRPGVGDYARVSLETKLLVCADLTVACENQLWRGFARLLCEFERACDAINLECAFDRIAPAAIGCCDLLVARAPVRAHLYVAGDCADLGTDIFGSASIVLNE